jgi:hypothetical protein
LAGKGEMMVTMGLTMGTSHLYSFIGKIGPDRTLANGDEKPLDDERPKRKLV